MASGPAPPKLFDHAFRRARFPRVARLRTERTGSDFLLPRACEDLLGRLQAVNRDFARAIDWMTPDARLAGALESGDRFVVRAAEQIETPRGCEILADAEHMPFAQDCADLVVSALALQWCEDLPGVLAQVRQCLRPDGLFLASLVGGRSLHELRAAFSAAEAEIEGGASPHVIPFVDVRDLGALMQRAGFALPVTDVESLVARYDSMFDLMADLRAMGAANPLRERRRSFMPRRTLLRAAELYARDHADADGRVRATFEIVWLSGWAPHESQQRPLKPGSATMSLAEALRTAEVRVSEEDKPEPP